ncbi:glycosyltransferase family 4 protein [Flavobacterium sp. SM15]|uniref:glycosyltransferase family 4 protein n=1 Tax=Flavobacterium sp. SM15 TaxID=2908005 RepID=UPI001EDBC27C|nr:glycosyltransferase family 4 protein [Flavobacterium sp. SM15]MCG2611253.1 glycosyltransferase family 4 protein [Flavobacterium sp. SM15]
MKIGFLTSEYPHPLTGNSGGIGTSIKGLAEGLIEKGHQVRVLVYGQDKDELFEQGNGLVIQRINNVKLKGLSWYLTRKKIEKLINSLYSQNLLDIVEAPDWTGITSFIQPEQCPVIIRLHGSDTYFCHLDNRRVKFINQFHEKRALEKADGHLSVSKFTADLTNELFQISKDFTVIPNGITLQKFKTDALVEQNEKIILYFGTLIRKKGLLELPLIFNKIVEVLPDVKLHLVGRDASDIITGNSSTWKMMQDLFTPKALKNVIYFGGVPYDEVHNHIQKAAICVFPTFAEALPVSWLEAMAMRKAIVASNIGWAKEIIENKAEGFLIHPSNHQEYADAVVNLLKDENLRKNVGHNAYQKAVEVFESGKIVDKNISFYEKIIKRNERV